jgi:serine/threonine-protein kinase
MGKIRERGIIASLAAFGGSGWLIYEIVHFVLVDHYHLPDELKDITIVTVFWALVSRLAWVWFRGEKKKRRIKWELVLIPSFVLAAGALNLNVLLQMGSHERAASSVALTESGWKNAVAVLPFANLSGDPEQDYFCDGLTEEMITKLSQVRELRVTARTSAFAFKGENRDIREIGQKLGVDKVLEGSVRKEGARLRISTQLINVADGYHLWSESYDRDLDKIFKVQDEISVSVARALKVTLLGGPQLPAQTGSLEAYDEFLLGQHDYANPTKENLTKAIGHYERAVELDPRYARAWAALGAALAFQANIGYTPVGENYPRAIAAVELALALDRRLAYAHSVMGWIRMTYNWDWAAAEACYEKALGLEAGRGLFGAAQLALALGRFDQAIAFARRVTEVDSLNPSAHMNLAVAALYAGRFEKAGEAFAKVILLSPERANGHALLAQMHLLQSLPEMALAEVEKEKDPYFRLPVQAMAYHSLGRAEESYHALARFIEDYWKGGAYQLAQIHAFRGDANQAFQWLEIAYSQRGGGLFLVKADPFLKRLKDDARYAAFLEKIGLHERLP